MPTFEARMRVAYEETWTVEAKNADEASQKFAALSDDVDTGDPCGEVVDWERSGAVKKVEDCVPYGFRMAVEHFNRPPPRNERDRILREAQARLDELLKRTHVRIDRLSAQDFERGRHLLENC
jgi:hypothetical protein